MMPLRIKSTHVIAKKKAFQILEKVGLEHKVKDQPATLSGGEDNEWQLLERWSRCRVLSLQMSQLEILIGIMPTMFFD